MKNIIKDPTRKQCPQNSKDTEMFKTKQRWLVVLIVVSILELVTLLGLAGYWRAMRDALLAPKQEDICLHLDKFITSRDEEQKLKCPDLLVEKFEKAGNTTSCCGTFSDVLDNLLPKAVREKYNSDINPEMAKLNLTGYNCKVSTKPQPKAKLVGLHKNKQPVVVGLSSKLFWSDESPSFTKSGLKHLVDDGTIYVETTGNYSVFVQMQTKLENVSDINKNTDDVFRHYVHLISKGGSTVILEDARTLCETTSSETEVTIVMGAVFRLHQGDRLYVATSHPNNAYSSPLNNYFSMHAI